MVNSFKDKSKIMQRYLPIIVFFLSFSTFGYNRVESNQETIFQQQFCDTIPFEYVRNKIIIEVKIGGEKKRFILDTGAISGISDKIQERMNNDVLDTTFFTDQSGIRKQLFVVSVKELTLGSLRFENIPSAVINIESTGFVSCLNYDGIIGSNLLANCIVHIDSDRKHIILTDNINNLRLVNAHKSIVTFDSQSSPYVQLSLNNGVKFDALFDSGADDFISISNNVFKETINNNLSKVLNEGYGSGAVGVFGIEKATTKKRIVCKEVKFGNNQIINFIAEVSDKTQNTIGMELAEYGTITVDYLNKQFYFVANQQSQEYKHPKTLGFSFQPELNHYSIGTVWTNTKAAKVGLKSGYQILKVDSLDIPTRTPQLDCILLLARPLHKEEVKITYKDDKNQIKVAKLRQE